MILQKIESLLCLLLLGDILVQDEIHFLSDFLKGKWPFEVFLIILGLLLISEGVLVLD